ncbi:V-set and immunoglobulin domain-containing protein 10-like [Cynoglossus semilaevis]|uniref:V-set and immunoglobulin domain-containing protein 10-like n=1 Tax=Cynoglossus semilaevis TaxID=244447 RepID=UPI000D62AA14|nr:V-set and immunoglobulin domain-containing protein 10-like [Cynoglossus semilaevis]
MNKFRTFFSLILFNFSLRGALCRLQIFSLDPQVKAQVGSNVTLSMTFSGAPDPVVTWFREDLPVLTWTVGSGEAPDVAVDHRGVLEIEGEGSLKFVNVPLNYGGNYKVELTKSGLDKAESTFTLTVFEIFQEVSLLLRPDPVSEGDTESFSLVYSMSAGVVEQQTWFFNGSQIFLTNSHYSLDQKNLVVHDPTRQDTGQYSVRLTNPFSQADAHLNVTVLYGPDEPTLQLQPSPPFFIPGDAFSLRCWADGFPPPTVHWNFKGQTVSESESGVLNRTHLQSSDGGLYTCTVTNPHTGRTSDKSLTIKVYEKPPGEASCSVRSANDHVDLQYLCEWTGGIPWAQLSFQAQSTSFNVSIVGSGIFGLTLAASDDLNGNPVTCLAVHPVQNSSCSATAVSPLNFLPTVTTTVDNVGRIQVTVDCLCQATPTPVMSWTRGTEVITNGTNSHISDDGLRLQIRSYNVSDLLQQTYTCSCRNPLGSQKREVQLLGPTISASSLFPNPDGSVLTLTWEVPPNAVVTGFDVQMKGPKIPGQNLIVGPGSSNDYYTILRKPGSARSADISNLDPKRTYRFRVIPKARTTEGEPSEVHRIGPGDGLSGSAVAGIAAGIPCSILVLLLLCGLLLFLWFYCNNNKSRQARYPVSRAVEKTITAPTDTSAHQLRTAGFKFPPDYNRLHQAASDLSLAPPTFVPPLPVRVATTV